MFCSGCVVVGRCVLVAKQVESGQTGLSDGGGKGDETVLLYSHAAAEDL